MSHGEGVSDPLINARCVSSHALSYTTTKW
jgi:hypothetical protein